MLTLRPIYTCTPSSARAPVLAKEKLHASLLHQLTMPLACYGYLTSTPSIPTIELGREVSKMRNTQERRTR